MIQNDLFITTVVMFLLSVIAFLLIFSVLIVTGFKYAESKKFKITPLNCGILIAALFILYLGLPFWFLSAAYKAEESEKAEKLYKLSINTSVIPSVKSFMTAELGEHYLQNFDGKQAIIAFENSRKIRDDKHASVMLCLLYSYKGDTENAVESCSKNDYFQSVAINYILAKDYKNAMEVINKSLKSDKKPSCWDYAVRAYIYRKLGKNDLFEKDYQKAKSLCPQSKPLESLYKNKNYYEEYYAQKKKEFKF